jgi:cytochrome c-type biogenesis protein CcmF
MIPEIGHFALILALSLALLQGVLPMIGAHRNDAAMMSTARTAAFGHLLFVAVAYACLTWAFLNNDFSVAYVANHSQLSLPTMYKVAAVWGGHEGSVLLWVLLLAAWTVAVAKYSQNLPESFVARVIAVLGLLSVGFLLFVLLTSNPFDRLAVPPPDGADLNPLLQDPGMAIHPPMLYVGYVGFSVAFAFAIAAMISGDLDEKWTRWTRPWTVTAWIFLTLGIALGSWWAYYELGWGGWWFWDPVENASFMPWLVGTALIHSLAVAEKRGLFKSWTLMLAIAAFSLSLLGTFLVRSGIIVSVHAFATDPARGVFILSFLGIVITSALVLYAWRAPSLDSEAGFSANFGTLAPLVYEVLDLGKISVGPPWFNKVFLLPMLPLVFLIGIGMHTTWRTHKGNLLTGRLRIPALLSIVLGILIPGVFYGRFGVMVSVGVIAALWVISTSLLDPIRSWRRAEGAARITPAVLGMSVAHFGVGLFILGVTITSAFNVETDMSMQARQSVDVAGHSFELRELRQVEGPNYTAIEGAVEIRRDGDFVAEVRPQKRQYLVQKNWMTEAGIQVHWNKDLFVALGDQLGNNTWSVRIQYKPMIRFIWLGCLVMALGGLIAVTDRRYRVPVTAKSGKRKMAAEPA